MGEIVVVTQDFQVQEPSLHSGTVCKFPYRFVAVYMFSSEFCGLVQVPSRTDCLGSFSHVVSRAH